MKRKRPLPVNPLQGDLAALPSIRTAFSRAARDRKKRILRKTAHSTIADPRPIRAWHDQLMFMAAYPDDAETLRVVDRCLRSVSATIRTWHAANRSAALARLNDTGMAHTTTCGKFTLPMCRWLIAACGNSVEIDWHDGSAGSALDEFLHHLVCSVERDGLLNDRYSTQSWFAASAGDKHANVLAWLVDRFEQSPVTDAFREHTFDSLDLHVRWRLDGGRRSRTHARFPASRTCYQVQPLMRDVDTCAAVLRPLHSTRRLPVTRARAILDVARVSLCVRLRETDALTYANERDVALLHMDRGIDAAVFGMTPLRRLPVESYFGFVAARNRVPVGYGGAWILGDRCEIGVNVFDEFRGGESAVIFSQIMRAYHQYLGPRRFYVDPFQFGQGNPEAIRSGAFWFYWRLGYRPTEASARKLALEESARIAADRSYRTPPTVLRRLARTQMLYDLDQPSAQAPNDDDFDLRELGIAMTRWIGRRFRGDRNAAQKWAFRRSVRILKPRGVEQRPENERASFANLSLLVGPIDDLPRWSAGEKEKLAALMFAKGGVAEGDYVIRLRRHRRLLEALHNLAASEHGRCD